MGSSSIDLMRRPPTLLRSCSDSLCALRADPAAGPGAVGRAVHALPGLPRAAGVALLRVSGPHARVPSGEAAAAARRSGCCAAGQGPRGHRALGGPNLRSLLSPGGARHLPGTRSSTASRPSVSTRVTCSDRLRALAWHTDPAFTAGFQLHRSKTRTLSCITQKTLTSTSAPFFKLTVWSSWPTHVQWHADADRAGMQVSAGDCEAHVSRRKAACCGRGGSGHGETGALLDSHGASSVGPLLRSSLLATSVPMGSIQPCARPHVHGTASGAFVKSIAGCL